ncbi:unnamed protein product [Phaedon cochleariae]|uniref:DUF4774 domain-containing protein n=1 Tax=Phaedon cochleariae TaxID=80249 RepID=A0A9P0D9A5_PHACE|nr:unnamed protein product [Phaedon cochleariae]
MRWFISMIAILSVVNCRPQNAQNTPGTTVELEKQSIVELKANNPDQKSIEANTNAILEKIAAVNKKQGVPKKQSTNNYFQIPSSFSRSQEEPKHRDTPRADFRFPTNPFSNPIFDYLERDKQSDGDEREHQTKYAVTNKRQSQQYPYPVGYEVSSTNHNAEVAEEDLIPGQYVKRKIVHQQSVLVPNPNYFGQPMMPPNYPPNNMIPYPMQTPFLMPGLPIEHPQIGEQNSTGEQTIMSDLERQTIDNIKNIVSNSQLRNPVYPGYYNPYEQQQIGNNPSELQYGFLDPNKEVLGQAPAQNPGYQIYGPFPLPNQEQARQNWNWPGANFFPIYIKDPFLQMYNAVTSMIEYGPNAGMQNPCPLSRPANKNKLKTEALLREGKTADTDSTKISVEVNGDSASPEITINGLNSPDNNGSYLDIENLDIGTGKDNSMKFTVSVKTEERVGKDSSEPRSTWDKVKVTGKSNSLVLNSSRQNGKNQELPKDMRPITIFKNQMPPKPTQTVLSPPIRDPTHQTDEFGDESEEDDKSEELISNDHNKKLFSRDNTGSGVFIHKLKVRKGGVAIAGPGGIATAGSGGTAIVGPNGIAYTQPDSLAIAGSGTKVIAVDPAVNLGELVNSTLGGNRTRLEGLAHSRVGKVVAVGPVVYYNKG